MNKINIKFESVLIVVILLISYCFLSYAYYVTTDATMRGLILGAVITTLTTVINWKFGSSKSSAAKDETIKSLQEAINQPSVVKAETVNADNVDTINTNTTNVNK